MTGTIVNAIAVLVAGILGVLARKMINNDLEKPIMEMIGLSVILIGLLGFISACVTVENNSIKTNGEILLLISLAFGAVMGELLKIEGKIGKLGLLIEKKAGISGFAKGFITSSILFCVGAMAIFGALQDGISGDSSVLFVKSAIDAVAAFILSATLGIGVCFSAISIFIYQGTIAMLSGYISPFISPQMMNGICMVGYAIVITLGTNMMNVTKIKTANLIPALIVPVIYGFIF